MISKTYKAISEEWWWLQQISFRKCISKNDKWFKLEMIDWGVIYNRYKVWDILQLKFWNIQSIRKRDWAEMVTKHCLNFENENEFTVYPNRSGRFLYFEVLNETI